MNVIVDYLNGLGNWFTVGYVIVQLGIFGVLIGKYIGSKKDENIILDNIQRGIQSYKNNNQEITNYTLNELFKAENQNTKYYKQWERYYNRISDKQADEKIKVEPFLGTGALHFAIGERGVLETGGGIHTSVGVLGTFIGLTIGLADLETNNTEQLKIGIDTLLSGMTMAFSTSIIGVLLSMAWIYFDRKFTLKLEDKIDWHANELSHLLTADDEELFLSRLEKISKQQADQLTTVLSDALEKTFTPFVQTLQSNNAQMATGFAQMEVQLATQNELTQQQIDQTKKNSNELSEKIVNSFTSDTKVVIEEFMNVLNHSKDLQESMIQVIGGITTNFEQASSKQELLFERTEKMAETYASLSEGMEKSQNSYEKTSEELAALSVSLKEVQQLSNAQLPLQQDILARSSEFVESSNDLVVQFSKFGNELKVSQDTMMQQLLDKTEMISTRFETLASELAQSAETYVDANSKNVDLITKTEQAAEKLTPVLGYMENTSVALENTMEQLEVLQTRQAELIPHLQEWNEDVLTYLKSFVGLSEKKMKELTTQMTQSKSQWESVAATFENTRSKLDLSMNNFAGGIDEGLTVTFKQFEKELMQVVHHFKSLSGTYLDSQESLTEAMNETVEKITAVRGKA